MKQPDAVRQEREAAWIGDAVLTLYARRWILERTGRMDQEMFASLTSNRFLSTIGQPTAQEARIGRTYQEGGLDAAFALIEAEMLPRFQAQEKNRRRGK
jgi:dsRNA-specific ribonuclease